MKYKFLIFLFLALSSFSQASEPLKVAVVDTGLDLKDPRFQDHICPTGHKDFTGTGLKDTHGHGTFVAGLIQKAAGDRNYCLLIFKYFSDKNSGSQNVANETLAIKESIEQGAKIVNVSGGGPMGNNYEYLFISSAPNVKFVVAAGNDGKNIDLPNQKFYPASYLLKNVIPVEAIDETGTRMLTSNWGKNVKVRELGDKVLSFLPNGKEGYMSGTSMATATATGKLVAKMLDTRDRDKQ